MALVFIASFIGSFGSAFLKGGAGRLELSAAALATNWRLILGCASYLLSSLFFVYGLRQGELSVLYPFVSLGYLWTLLWSRLFFHEPITRPKIAGVGLILLGIVLLGFGNR